MYALIVIKDTTEKLQKRIKPAYVALRGLGIPKDILVYTVEEFVRKVHKNFLEPKIRFCEKGFQDFAVNF